MDRCFRCGGAGSDWHHRRSRAVKDAHQHCPCNGVWLCRTCHKWAHDHPFEARAVGLIVTRYQPTPYAEPATTHFGEILLACDGGFSYFIEQEQEQDDG